jgi:regulator of sirC expression with transglutaminase-like and TPR domain
VAIERYTRFIKAHPELPPAISNCGQIYLEVGSYELAIADLEVAEAVKVLNHRDTEGIE